MLGEGSPRKLTGSKALSAYLERTEPAEWGAVFTALFRIRDHQWEDAYEWFEDLTQEHTYVLVLRDDLWMVWRIIRTYPNYYEVIYLGHPDDTTHHG